MKPTLLATAVGLVTAWGSLGMGQAILHPRRSVGKEVRFSMPHSPRSDNGLDYASTAKSAIETMNTLYNDTQGRWAPEIAWWISGVALQGLADYMNKTGSYEYFDQANYIIDKQKQPLPWWPQGKGLFRADSTDDTAWWALALLGIFDLSSNDEWCLETAKTDEEYMYKYWSTDDCGGGLVQDIRKNQYKNAISNQLYTLLTASLHNRIPGDTEYLAKAKTAWDWLFASGMVNEDHFFNDGLTKNDDGTCFNNNQTAWTYNQGVILGAATGTPCPHPHPPVPRPHTNNPILPKNSTTPPTTKPTLSSRSVPPTPSSPAPRWCATASSSSRARRPRTATTTSRPSRASLRGTWRS